MPFVTFVQFLSQYDMSNCLQLNGQGRIKTTYSAAPYHVSLLCQISLELNYDLENLNIGLYSTYSLKEIVQAGRGTKAPMISGQSWSQVMPIGHLPPWATWETFWCHYRRRGGRPELDWTLG